MVPHGDPVHAAQSSRVEDQVPVRRPGNDNIMAELILDHDLRDVPWWKEGESPAHDAFQGCQGCKRLHFGFAEAFWIVDCGHG